ncbi:MAG: DUF1801 domain-containing protein [bacterium]|nr:DUF1801 domain-containing protein [bacterium]
MTKTAKPPFEDEKIAAIFEGYPPKARRRLLELRALIFRTARETDGVGPLEETLKWSEPAYVTSETKSGTTVRIDWKDASPDSIQLYVHCQTSLIERFREEFDGLLEFEGNRAIRIPIAGTLPREPLGFCIAEALTYHLQKKRKRRR